MIGNKGTTANHFGPRKIIVTSGAVTASPKVSGRMIMHCTANPLTIDRRSSSIS